jgi:membrane protease YdiL (CAAX protease family)
MLPQSLSQNVNPALMRIATRLGLFVLCLLFTIVVWPFLWEVNLLLDARIPWSVFPVVLVAIYALRRGAAYTSDTFWPAHATKLVFTVCVGLIMAVSQVGIYLAYSALFDGPTLTLGYLSTLPWIVAAAFCVTDSVVGGIVEEFAYRGLLQPELERAMGRYLSIAITTGLFVASHFLKPGFAHLAPHFVLLSATYGYVASRTRSFVLVAVAHSIHNVLAYLITFVATAKNGGALLEGTVRSTTLGAVSLSLLAITVAVVVNRYPPIRSVSRQG